MVEYKPSFHRSLPRPVDVPTAWKGLEQIIPAIITDFDLNPYHALEFGVDYGFSTVALANYFEKVDGVDTFRGDPHAGDRGENGIFEQVRNTLRDFPNIVLHPIRYEDWILFDDASRYDLIHVDIVHTYEDTFNCGKWALNHSPCVIFHDYYSFPDVGRACEDLAQESGRTCFVYPKCHGLAILREGR